MCASSARPKRWKKPGFWVCACVRGLRGRPWQPEFGRDRVEIFQPVVRELCRLELLTDEEGMVSLTPRGVLFSNEVFARFLGVGEPELQVL